MDPQRNGQQNDKRHPEDHGDSLEEQPPPLPPRASNIGLLQSQQATSTASRPPTRIGLVSGATTALSMTDVNSYLKSDGSRELRTTPSRVTSGLAVNKSPSGRTTESGDDSASVRSFLPFSKSDPETSSIFGGALEHGTAQEDEEDVYREEDNTIGGVAEDEADVDFEAEFASIKSSGGRDDDQERVRELWKSKKKHFLILSAAGKPIYTRHGSDSIISNYVGILQAIISSYASWNSQLRSFKAGDTIFVVLSETNLFLVAISNLPESESQLRIQLEALYMQILSTLTLPHLTHIFSVRPSTDLRRPLEGTEVLLSALADSFTRGSPSTLLSALESLRMRKAHRQVINNTLIKARVDELLYGLIVAGGRLVSVIRPKKHSLHPSDLHLIFNMLFEAEGIKAGGGDSFIPICLPAFNKTGYLHMYVSFLNVGGGAVREIDHEEKIKQEDAVAVILLSTEKESFDRLRSMKSYLIHELHRNGSMRVIQNAVQSGRPSPTDIIPGTALRHFLYKSKGNVQYFMPAFGDYFQSMNHRRQLLSLYHVLHASVHAKHAAVKVQHTVSSTSSALAWVTPMFELYCVAGRSTPRNALAQSANKIVQWVQREEERIFLIGGAVF